MSRIIGYLRVSSEIQDLNNCKDQILHFANNRGWGPVIWSEEKISGTVDWRKREIGKVLEELQAGDVIITAEISRFARSLKQVIEIMELAKKKEISVYAIKGGWELNGNIESKVMLYMLGLFAEVERDLVSMRTKEALASRKASGVRLGRPKGPGKSKLDQHRVEIIALLRNGSRKNFIAERYGVTDTTLYNWISKHGLEQEVQPRVARATA